MAKKTKSETKSPVNPIARAEFDAIVERHPLLKVEEKAGWTKLEGPSGLRIYVARQKNVRHVHLAGFGGGADGTTPPDPNGRVQAHLDFRCPPEAVLGAFDLFCRVVEEAQFGPPPRKAPTAREDKPRAKGKKARKAELESELKKAKAVKRTERARAAKAKEAEAEREAREERAAKDDAARAAEIEAALEEPLPTVTGAVSF